MPTVLIIGAFRFHFYSNEGTEPPHIHVDAGDGECKFWLEPVRLAWNRGLSAATVRKIEHHAFSNQDALREKCHEFHRR